MRITLRDKFIIPTIAIFLMGMGISSAITYTTASNALESTITHQVTLLADAITNNLSAWIERNKLDITRWSREDIFRDAVPDSFLGNAARKAANPQLAHRKNEYRFYESIFLCDSRGTIIAASDPSLMAGPNVSLQPFFQSARNGSTFTSDVTADAKNGDPVFFISAPVKERDRVIGALVGKINLSYFNESHVGTVRPGKTGYAFIADRDGQVIAHPDKGAILKTNLDQYEWGAQILQKRNGIVRYGQDAVKTISAVREDRQMGWIVGVNAPVEEIFASAHRIKNQVVIVTGIISLLIGATVTLIITRFVTGPIATFIRSMETVAAGNLDQKIRMDGADEFSGLARSFNRMAKSLRESEQELKQTYRELAHQQRMAAMGELTARIAHEIKNPLGIIKGSAQILVDETEPPEIKTEVGRYIIEEVNQLRVRIHDLLSHAKPMPPNLESVDLNQILEERIRFWESQKTGQGRIVVERAFNPAIPPLNLDRKLIKQLTLNLIINASEAMDQGGRLTIATDLHHPAENGNGRLKNGTENGEHGRQDGRYVQLLFEDTGMGIPEENQQKIFDPFFTTKEKGTGLGLSAVYRIVDKHGGKIGVVSAPGKGTRFTILLPLKAGAKNEHA